MQSPINANEAALYTDRGFSTLGAVGNQASYPIKELASLTGTVTNNHR